MDIKIYIMTHKPFDVPVAEGYYAMQVGREGNKDLGYLRDDLGEHISQKNRTFCELTGLYWIWKNVKSDVVGLCHYRRYFIQAENKRKQDQLESMLLPVSYIEQCMQQYDLIVPGSGMTKYGSVFQHYKSRHCVSDWEECGRVIQEKYPQYYPAFLWNQETNIMTMGNMVIGKKAVIDAYCEWLFDILFEVESRIDLTDHDDYQKRIFGFLSERLFRVWVFMQQLKIREESTEMFE
ncbi:MAG: DUF4422 domain-containing protein [Eubacterium sp.]|nr:DUF4422 domain-containing protein [Eubacterium sp.]MCI8919673.1 DUF4422 domain-containing protein [Eubacterium sp.]